jgi:ArsR family transcriptional regulator
MTADTEFPIVRLEELECTARLFKAISHPLRLKILCAVANKELHEQEINERTDARLRNISHHLGILCENGALRSRKVADHVYYRVGDPTGDTDGKQHQRKVNRGARLGALARSRSLVVAAGHYRFRPR